MMRKRWQDIYFPSSNESEAWETFHENSKTGRYDDFLASGRMEILAARFGESLFFDQYPSVELPSSLTPLDLPLGDALRHRTTAQNLEASSISLQDLATLLYYAYGVNRSNQESDFRRPLRVIPSAGALYPLELFVHTSHVVGLQAGLYHYNPTQHILSFISPDDKTSEIAAALVQRQLAVSVSLMMFISAKLEGATIKYGNRGYRFVLLEAGHAAQNINLVANGLGLGCVNIGGYFDRMIDELLRLDGLTHSTIYMVGIGKDRKPSVAGEGE